MNPLHPDNKVPRQDPEIPLEVSAEILTNPKAKNSGSFRRTMLRSRSRVIVFPRQAGKTYAQRVEAFARSRDASQLCRLLSRLPKRHDRLQARLEELNAIENPTMQQMQEKNLVEMSKLDVSHHLVAVYAEHQKRRGVRPSTQ